MELPKCMHPFHSLLSCVPNAPYPLYRALLLTMTQWASIKSSDHSRQQGAIWDASLTSPQFFMMMWLANWSVFRGAKYLVGPIVSAEERE